MKGSILFHHPDAQRRFRVMNNVEELAHVGANSGSTQDKVVTFKKFIGTALVFHAHRTWLPKF